MNVDELLLTLSSNIKRYRKKQKWTQAELAEKVNISLNFMNDIETSKKWPSPVTLVKFAEIFKIEAYELLKQSQIAPDSLSYLRERYMDKILTAITEVNDEYLAEINKNKSQE